MQKTLTNKTLIGKLYLTIKNRSLNKKLYVVGISGLDASGKSKIAEQIKKKADKEKMNVWCISGDSFQYPKKYKENLVEKDWALQHVHRTINFDSMITNLLKPLQQFPSVIKLNLLNYDSGEREEKEIDLKYPILIIIESIYLFQPNIVKFLDYKIYLELDTETALKRAKERPRDLYLYKSRKGVEDKYITKNFAGYNYFVTKYHPQQISDIVIDNNNWRYPVINYES